MSRHKSLGLLVGTLATLIVSPPISAQEIEVLGVFNIHEQRSANDIGIGIGQRIAVGAFSVVPNGGAGTVGIAEQAGQMRTLFWFADPLAPNFFINAVSDTTLTGAWTLTFMNSCCPDKIVETPPTTDVPPPFVENVTISGPGTAPTFAWTVPAGFVPDAVTIVIRDKSLGTGSIHAAALAATATSYDVPTVLSSGLSLDPGNTDGYVFEVRLVELRDPTQPAFLSNNLGRSRSFVNFHASEEPFPDEGVFIPAVTVDGVFTFNVDVSALEPILLDPPVAVGYHLAIGTGDPLFDSVTLPEAGDNVFTVTYDDGGPVMEIVAAGEELLFPPSGVSEFTVTGIEPEAALDPRNATAFMIRVSFVTSGKFTGTMTPITIATGPVGAEVDIKPGSAVNPVNTRSRGKLPVALLGSFDLDVTTLSGIAAHFGPGSASNAHDLNDATTFEDHLGYHNDDSHIDLMFHFEQKAAGLRIGDSAACLLVMTDQGDFGGCDSVKVLR